VASTVHRLKATLQGTKPPIWRRVEVGSDITLAELSGVLEAAMGWLGGHLHGFDVNGVQYQQPDLEDGMFEPPEDETKHRVGEVLADTDAKMRWDYDFGDGWEHKIEVEAIEPQDPTIAYPRCITGRRACPPEDCGGIWGFAELLDAIADKTHPRHDELSEWLPIDYDPSHFAAAEITNDMRSPRPLAGW
jgi:hypothetical protein